MMSLLIDLCVTEVRGVLMACALITIIKFLCAIITIHTIPTWTHTVENKFILIDEKRRTSIALYIPDVNQPKKAELRTATNVSIYSTVYEWPLLLGYSK